MPLLEIVQVRKIAAYINLEETTAQQVDQYAAFLHATADDVIDKALAYVFSKDREFQDFLRAPGTAQPIERLRIRRAAGNGAENSGDAVGAKAHDAREKTNDGRLRS